MRVLVIAAALACASCAIAQTSMPAQKPMVTSHAPARGKRFRQVTLPGGPAASVKPANVPPTAPVVTLKGVCGDRKTESACQSVITREDLDKFVSLFAPDASEAARGRLA